jgi:hypothetical protein
VKIAVDDRQRRLLLDQWRTCVADFSSDFDAHGRLDPRSARIADHGSRLVEWLDGGSMPGADTRRFLEEIHEAFKKDSGYDDLVEEHDLIVAAIEGLR